MTRETKIGLVVSCSFLCLVGVVLVCKLREGDSGSPAQTETSPDQALASAGGPTAAGAVDPPKEHLTDPGSGKEAPAASIPPVRLASATGDEVPPPPPTPPPPAPATPPEMGDGQFPPSPLPQLDPAPPPVALPPPLPAAPIAAQAATTEGDKDKTPPSPAPATEPDKQNPPPPAVNPGDPRPVSPSPAKPTPPPGPSGMTDEPPPPAPPGDKPSPAIADLPPPPPPAALPDPPPEGKDKTPPDKKTAPVPPENKEAHPSPPASLEKPMTAAPPPPPSPSPDPAVRLGQGGIVPIPPPPPAAPGVAPTPPQPAAPAGDDAPDRSVRVGPPQPVTPPAQVAQAPAPLGAALGGRPAPALPQVESFDEELYRCKAGDTFETISQRYYHTDKYARALLLFNRAHPMAGDGVQQNPPALAAGQAVYLPPLRILEKRHAAAIPELTPLPKPALPPPGEAMKAAPAANLVRYRVGAVAEHIRDVAQRTLGNADRWMEIYQLNRNVAPEKPLPANTVLTLPADARVPPENAL